MSAPESNPQAAILGCSTTGLSAVERNFFRDADPLGFILFERNCRSRAQVRRLINDLRDCVERADAPILIDQEGGRVARLKPPEWPAHPPAGVFAEMARTDMEKARRAARLNARLIADELAGLGVTVNCAPVLDIPQSGADPIIGDRAAGDTVELAVALGEAACEGFLDGGILPVIKHIPGHGRANVDSHKALPVVDTPLEDLEAVDFAPFRALNNMPWAMTGHVLYKVLDDTLPATMSGHVIKRVIREGIGFDGLLISDDLSMEALSGNMENLAESSVAAGCDVVLHCNGDIDEMRAVVEGCGRLGTISRQRFERAEAMRRRADELDTVAAARYLNELLKDYLK